MSLNYKWDKERQRQKDTDRHRRRKGKKQNQGEESISLLVFKSHHGVTEHTENQPPLKDQTRKNTFGLMFPGIGFKGDLLFILLATLP